MKIVTEYWMKPIPIRCYDWSAYDDDTYEPGCPIGHGPTEEAAIADLYAQLIFAACTCDGVNECEKCQKMRGG